MADREKKREDGNTKIWISQEQDELFRWNKKHFEGLSFGEKILKQKQKKIADTSFNGCFTACIGAHSPAVD